MLNPNIASDARFAVRGDRRSGIDRLSVAGELDVVAAPFLQQGLDAVVHAGGALILDLRDLTFMDGIGLRTVERAAEYARRDAWRLCIVNCQDAVRDVFETAGTDHLLSGTHVSDLLDSGDGGWSPIPLPGAAGQRRDGLSGDSERRW